VELDKFIMKSIYKEAKKPYPLPVLPSLPGRTCSALISNFVEEKTEA
jgi:hypothetical protein